MIVMQVLKNTKFYWHEGVKIQFRAEIVTQSLFKVPVAKFVFPDKTYEVKREAFATNQELVITPEPLPFPIEFNNGVWKAPLREAI